MGLRYLVLVTSTAAAGLGIGRLALEGGAQGGGDLSIYAGGLALAAAASLGGFALLRWGIARGSELFLTILLGLFLGRVALIALFGLAIIRFAPAHLAVGLLSLAGFHFIFAVIEITLLARPSRGAGVRTTAPTGQP